MPESNSGIKRTQRFKKTNVEVEKRMSRLNERNVEFEKRRSYEKTTIKLNFDRKNAPYKSARRCVFCTASKT